MMFIGTSTLRWKRGGLLKGDRYKHLHMYHLNS